MDVLDLYGKISLDTSEYEQGLESAGSAASGFAEKLGAGLAKAAKIGVAALAAAEAAVGAFVKSSIDTGMQFDSAMSQVAATMGLTTEDIKNNVNGAGDTFDALREKALEMGSTTNFTAQQAAEGLNILAMSGYDAESSMAMIEDVLHLAAAGSMDMASAAGYVSGAMKGFADSSKDAEYYADLMAKGATLANTDVSALGEALAGGAAAAKSYGQSADTVTVALLRLAEQGDTGSAAATALSAAMKNLYAPTDQAKKALQELGVQAFDPATGSARDFNQVVNELEAALSGYSDEQKTAYAQTIFGIQGFDAYNKMIVTSADKQQEWAAALADSSGEAARQYATMTDNLAGDIDLWNSALDGFRIALSDQLMPAIREFVQFGGNSMGKLTDAFQEGGLSGLMEALGGVLSDGLSMITEMLPDAIDAGMGLLGALGQGILDNLPALANAALQIISTLAGALMDAVPRLFNAGIEIIQNLSSGVAQAIPDFLNNALPMILNFTQMLRENFGNFVDAGIDLILNLVKGIADGLPALIAYVPQIVSNIAGLINDNGPKILEAGIQIIITLGKGLIEAIPALVENIPQIITAIVDVITAFQWLDLGKSIIDFFGNGIKNMVSFVKESAGSVREGVIDALKNLPKTLLDLGKQIFTNFGQAIQNMKTWVMEKAASIASGLLSVLKELPSKAVQIGKDLLVGLWNGIWDKVEWLKQQVGGVVNKIKSWFTGKDGFDEHSPSKWAEQVGAYVSEGLAEGMEKKSGKVKKTAEQIAKDTYTKLKTWADRQTKYMELSYDEQIELWMEIQRQFKEGSEQYAQAEEKIFDLRQAKAKETAQAEKKALEEQKKALKEREKALEEYKSKAEKIHKEIAAAEQEYQDKLASRTQQIMQSYGLFDELPKKEKVTGDQLLKNLNSQVVALDEFYGNLDKLEARGVGAALVDEIRQMGPKAKDQLNALLAMGDDKLGQYAELYAKKQKLASETATAELSDFLRETEGKIEQSNQELKQLNDEYGPKIGVALTDGMSWGVKQGMSKVAQAAVNTVQNAYRQAMMELDRLAAGMGGGAGYQMSIRPTMQAMTAGGVQGLNYGNVDFGQSAAGLSSAALMGGLSAAAGQGQDVNLTVELKLDGTKAAQALFEPLVRYAKANGTPIVNPNPA